MLAISRPQFKKISSADLATICDWHREHVKINFPDSKYKRDRFYALLWNGYQKMCNEKNEILLKLVLHYDLIGFLWLKKIFDVYKDYYYCDLHYIQIASSYRGRGYGAMLMQKTEQWAKKNKIQEIRLGTNSENTAALNLYLNCGYKYSRIIMEKKICLPKRK